MGRLGQFFRYKVFVDALFHSEVMSIFNLPIDNRYFTLIQGVHDTINTFSTINYI